MLLSIVAGVFLGMGFVFLRYLVEKVERRRQAEQAVSLSLRMCESCMSVKPFVGEREGVFRLLC